MPTLDTLRKQIDAVDEEILKQISKRGKVAQQIGHLKQDDGAAVYVPSREKLIYERLEALNEGPYSKEAIRAIFGEIISATRALEAPIRVSYLGPLATFTQMAAVKYFGSAATLSPSLGIETIFKDVERGAANYGVVPIENSTEGVVSHTLDRFTDSALQVCAEIVLKVSHHFMSLDSDLSQIKVVYSHPQALAQCRQWLLSHIPQAHLKETESTAVAAQKAAGEPHSGAIAAEIASSVYGVPILHREIQDQSLNFTRFLVIGHHTSTQKSGNDKTSLLFTIKDEAGGLYKVLGYFAREKVNLSKIESRPLKKKAWEYIFFVDLDGHMSEARIRRALEKVKAQCDYLKILGSYPKSQIFS